MPSNMNRTPLSSYLQFNTRIFKSTRLYGDIRTMHTSMQTIYMKDIMHPDHLLGKCDSICKLTDPLNNRECTANVGANLSIEPRSLAETPSQKQNFPPQTPISSSFVGITLFSVLRHFHSFFDQISLSQSLFNHIRLKYQLIDCLPPTRWRLVQPSMQGFKRGHVNTQLKNISTCELH